MSPNPTENGLDPLSWTYFDDLEKKLREWQDIYKPIQENEIGDRKEKIQKVSIQVLDILEQEKNVDRKQFAIMNNFRYVRAVFINTLIGIFYGSQGMNIKHDKYYSTKKINLKNEMLKLIVANINFERKRYDENLTDLTLEEILDYKKKNKFLGPEQDDFVNSQTCETSFLTEIEKQLYQELETYLLIPIDKYQERLEKLEDEGKKHEIMADFIIERIDKAKVSLEALKACPFPNVTDWENMLKSVLALETKHGRQTTITKWEYFEQEIKNSASSSIQEVRRFFFHPVSKADAHLLADFILSLEVIDLHTINAISARIRNMEGISENRKLSLLKGLQKLKGRSDIKEMNITDLEARLMDTRKENIDDLLNGVNDSLKRNS